MEINSIALGVHMICKLSKSTQSGKIRSIIHLDG